MRVRDLAYPAAALLMGAVSTEVADDWATRSRAAEAWFYALVPGVLDILHPAQGWAVAVAVYALQYLALYLLADAAWSAFRPVFSSLGPSSSPKR
jgi:hypothetical protein